MLVQTFGAMDSLPGVVYVPPVAVSGYSSIAVQAVTRAGEGMNALKRPIVQPTASYALWMKLSRYDGSPVVGERGHAGQLP